MFGPSGKWLVAIGIGDSQLAATNDWATQMSRAELSPHVLKSCPPPETSGEVLQRADCLRKGMAMAALWHHRSRRCSKPL
mmetsp:Transcript_85752/g.218669  ORF Transcript_85752/g.218669 Transcript_85752/m.218669 type:complete len:80 (-) Transcript_85752:132-371(-)